MINDYLLVMFFKNKRWNMILLAIALILLVPLIAMIFSDEVNWSAFDFFVATILLLSTSFILDVTVRKINYSVYKIAICITICLVIIIIWAELAVGIFDSPFAGN